MAKELDVESILREHPSRFESKPFHSEEGDCVFYYFEDVDYDYERIDCWLSVYYARDDHRLVLCRL